MPLTLTFKNYNMENLSTNEISWSPLKRISWSAVFAGVLIAVIIQFLLSLLGIGIGMSSIDATEEHNPVKGLGMATMIWYVSTSLISLFTGGWIAGKLAQTPRRFDGFLHGVLMWSMVTLITFYLLTTAIGNIIGGVGKIVGQTLSTAGNIAGKGIEMVAPKAGEAIQNKMEDEGINLRSLKQDASNLLRQTGKQELQPKELNQDSKEVGNEIKNADKPMDEVIDDIFNKGKAKVSEIDREAAINVIVARTGKTEGEANQVVDNWINNYKQMQEKVEQVKQEAEAKARQVADDSAKAVSKAAFVTFISLLIGCIVAGLGARLGNKPKTTDTYRETSR